MRNLLAWNKSDRPHCTSPYSSWYPLKISLLRKHKAKAYTKSESCPKAVPVQRTRGRRRKHASHWILVRQGCSTMRPAAAGCQIDLFPWASSNANRTAWNDHISKKKTETLSCRHVNPQLHKVIAPAWSTFFQKSAPSQRLFCLKADEKWFRVDKPISVFLCNYNKFGALQCFWNKTPNTKQLCPCPPTRPAAQWHGKGHGHHPERSETPAFPKHVKN